MRRGEREAEMIAGMAMHPAMLVQAPSTSNGVAMPLCRRVKVVPRNWNRGFVAGEKASFAVGDGGLLFTLRAGSGGKRRKKNGGRACVFMAADYYKTLGVSKTATKSEIKSAYRKLARKVFFLSLLVSSRIHLDLRNNLLLFFVFFFYNFFAQFQCTRAVMSSVEGLEFRWLEINRFCQ